MSGEEPISVEIASGAIGSRIFLIRDTQVMLDRDLAEFYEVKPIRLREQVKRNAERFPPDFMFQLTNAEVDIMVSQSAIPSLALEGSKPKAFLDFISEHNPDADFDEKKALFPEWKSADLLFQLTDEELSRETSLFHEEKKSVPGSWFFCILSE